MKFWTHFRTCNRFGAHASVWAVGDYLSLDCPSFGTAITELNIEIYFDTNTGDVFRTPFDSYIKTLPRSRFFRKKASFQLCLLSTRDSRSVDDYKPPRLELFSHCAKEVGESLGIVREKIKKSDDFDFAAFLKFIRTKTLELPTTEEGFASLLNTIERTKAKTNQP